MKIAPKDAPDGNRKPQSFAVPTSGGIAIALAILICSSGYLRFGGFMSGGAIDQYFVSYGRLLFKADGWCLFTLPFFVMVLGAADDRFDMPAKPKFAALAGLALLAAGFGQHIDGVFLPVADAYFPLATWLGVGGTAMWLFILMNAANFMDGSNGLSMGTLAIMIGGIGLYLLEPIDGFEKVLSVLIAITVATFSGFLFWNLQGKLYAGDAGSLFGGAAFGVLSIYAAYDGNIWFPATLALPFLVDVFMTLFWRAGRRDNLLEPHRHHAYQGLIKSGWGHLQTALLWWTFAAICAAAALWAASDSKAMSAYVFLGMLGLGCGLWIAHRFRMPKELTLSA